mmetsp:Transcript_49689/g.120451  ORF Transcript_49689/g.120451 Transcript_49689/m.120451 type:complete len:427 (+) Transcript_49689:84-1364(+)
MSTNPTTAFVSRHARSSYARRNSLRVGSHGREPRARSAERQTPKHSDFDDVKLKLELEEEELTAAGSGSPKVSAGKDQSFGNETGDDGDDGGNVQSERRRSLTWDHNNRNINHDNLRQSLIREASIAQVTMGHRRANSDPFDDAGIEEIVSGGGDDVVDKKVEAEAAVRPLPTMQRFPYAATQNRNTWSEPPCDIFKVRGGNYLKDKKKVSSEKYLLNARGSDLFLTEHPEHVDMSKLSGALGGTFRKKPTLMIRFLFPWGILNQYYEVPPKLVPFMDAGTTYMDDKHPAMAGLSSNSEKALAKWLAGDSTYRNDRLKLIAFVPEGPWIVRNMVTGRPAIIGHKLPVKYSSTPKQQHNCEFLQVDLDINSSKPTAKKIVSVCRRYMSSLGVDIGFVIEGKTNDDLPEEMLGAVRLHQADPSCSPTL